jgi:hypothetical protein
VCLALAVYAGPAAALPIGVPSANPDTGTPPNKIVNGYQLVKTASNTDPLENPSGPITTFGRLSDGTATEPDGNTYLVLPDGVGGPTAGYDYGHHFVFQGHENEDDLAYVTRVNLDVSDPAHRITLLTPTGSDGLTHFDDLDGTTWDPFTRTLLFTQEAGPDGGVIEMGPDGSHLHTLDGVIGKGSYEGIRADDHGNLVIDEDEGGTTLHTDPNDPNSPTGPRQPNSFLYRFVPNDRADLSAGGVLQALQVTVNGTPVIFHPNDAVGDTFTSQGQLKINTPGTSWPTRWVTLHNTSTDGFAPFDANAAAKAAAATPFKRPENGAFQPGSDFQTYVFDATGDTNANVALAPAAVARGGWGSALQAPPERQRLDGQDLDRGARQLRALVLRHARLLGQQPVPDWRGPWQRPARAAEHAGLRVAVPAGRSQRPAVHRARPRRDLAVRGRGQRAHRCRGRQRQGHAGRHEGHPGVADEGAIVLHPTAWPEHTLGDRPHVRPAAGLSLSAGGGRPAGPPPSVAYWRP